MDLHPVVREDVERILTALGPRVAALAGADVLLTGGAGFLGHYLSLTLLHGNDTGRIRPACHLTLVDNLIRGEPRWLRQLRSRPDVTIHEGDITRLSADALRADFVLHAASIASPTYYRLHPIETMDANVIGLRRLLDLAVAHPVRSFLFFSSSEVYGDPDPGHVPTAESYWGNVSCIGPRACYDESKRFGETLSVNFWRTHRVPVKIVRPFNNYGPGLALDDRRVVPDFCRCVLEQRDIVLLSDGTPTRTFCYVSDAVTGFYLLLLSDLNGEPVNIGSDGPELSVAELAALVVRASGGSVKVVRRTSEDADYLRDSPARRCPDLTRARGRLGYAPVVSIEQGLRNTLTWYRHLQGQGEGR
jgi:UDP-glucuronate decarboxylase